MARQLAHLVATSDVAELTEAIRRWKESTPSEETRRLMEEMGGRILDVRRALDAADKQPTEDELEEVLRIMLLVATDPQAVKPPKE
jgi:hypothetical protein